MSTRAVPTHNLTTFTLLLIVGSLMTVSALATDVLLPAFPAMATELGVSDAAIQRVLSMFMLGYAVPQLFVGSLADRFGRRPILLAGLTVYGAGSVLCLLAPTYDWLIAARIIQGVGAAAGPVLARAVLRDLYSGRQLGRMLSFAMIFFTAAPLLAPSVGALLLQFGDYHLMFWFLLLVAALMFVMVLRLLPETVPALDARATDLRSLLHNARLILFTPRSGWAVAVMACCYGVLMAYLASAPTMFIGHYGLNEARFGMQFAVVASIQLLIQPLNARLLNTYGPEQILRVALPLFVLVGIALTVQTSLGIDTIWSMTFTLMGMLAAFSLILANVTTLVLEPHRERAGVASGMSSFAQIAVGTLLGTIIAATATNGPLGLAVGILILSVLALLAFTQVRRYA